MEKTVITGATGTGKTQLLIDKVAELLNNGVPANNILVTAASPLAAMELTNRLSKDLQKADVSALPRIATARQLALEILDSEKAFEFTGRKAKLLLPYEEMFLAEDMKVSGLRPKRLREMMKFFYRSWAELEDRNEDWLVTSEEIQVHSLLKKQLSFMEAVLEPEAANLALAFIENEKATGDSGSSTTEAFGFDYIFADDYQNYSKASQQLVCALAKSGLTIAGDASAWCEVFDSYPYPLGLEEFLQANPQAEVEDLGDAAFCCTEFNTLICDTPLSEFEEIAKKLKDIKTNDDATSLCICTPNRTWTKNLAKALEDSGVAADSLFEASSLSGDIREESKCETARFLTLLQLAANPTDSTAWRCWCGFGDYLALSAVFAQLSGGITLEGDASSGVATQEDTAAYNSVYEALNALCSSANTTSGLSMAIERFNNGREALKALEGLTGSALLQETAKQVGCEGVPGVIQSLLADYVIDGKGPKEICNTITAAALFPTVDYPQKVAILPYDNLCGLRPSKLLVTGFMNGFIPIRDYFDGSTMTIDQQTKEKAKNDARIKSLKGKALKSTVVSYFEEADLETADALKLKISRIRMVDGERICKLEPSEYLEALQP